MLRFYFTFRSFVNTVVKILASSWSNQIYLVHCSKATAAIITLGVKYKSSFVTIIFFIGYMQWKTKHPSIFHWNYTAIYMIKRVLFWSSSFGLQRMIKFTYLRLQLSLVNFVKTLLPNKSVEHSFCQFEAIWGWQYFWSYLEMIAHNKCSQ